MPDRNRATRRALCAEGALLILSTIVFALVLLLPLTYAHSETYTIEEQKLWDAWQNDELIRLHILADSDEPEAQRVKLQVRDAIIEAFGATFDGVQNCDEVYALLQSNAEAMRLVAQRCARGEGFAGAVTAEVGVLELPEKQYGRVTLPAGPYRALRITLGSGNGQNWWCVLFPQLCLVLAQDEAVQPDVVWSSEQIFENWLLLSP